MLMRASGSYFEIGRVCGALAGDAVRRKLAALNIPAAYGEAEHVRLRRRLEGNMQRHSPGLLEELHGWAEGSGIPFEEVFTLNAIAEMPRAPEVYCSSVGFADTPEGVIIAKTNDGGSSPEDDAVADITPPTGHRVLVVTWPGTTWAYAGLNDAGVALGGSTLFSGSFNPDGIPSNSLPRIALEQAGTALEAAAVMADTPFMCHPFAYSIGDAEGDLIAVEQDVDRQVIRRQERRAVFTANFFASAALEARNRPVDDYMATVLQNSRDRFANLARLTETLPHTRASLERILRDHTQPGAICQHPEGNAAGMSTYNTFLMLARERALLVSYGRLCADGTRLKRFALDDAP
jgi:isopenicillin-N N-acyltransferase like protein